MTRNTQATDEPRVAPAPQRSLAAWVFCAAASGGIGPMLVAITTGLDPAHARALAVGTLLSLLAGGLAAALTLQAQRRDELRWQRELRALELAVDERDRQLGAVARDLTTITDALPSLLTYWDKNLHNRFANRAYRCWFDVDAAALPGMSMQDLVGAELFARSQAYVEAAVRGEAMTFERTLTSKRDGTSTQFMTHYIPDILDGEVRGFYVMMHDINSLKQAQQRVADSEKFLEQAGAVAGVGGFRIDLLSGQQTWTRQTFTIFGVAGDVAPSAEEFDKLMTPDVGARLWRAIRTASETGSGYDLEMQAVTTDGRPIWVHTIGVVEFENGKPARVVGAVQDVTERRRAAQALVDSEARYRSFFELSPVGIAVTDLQTGQFLHVNDALAAPTGYTRHELLHKTYWDITPPRFTAQETAIAASLERHPEYGPYEKEYMRKDGSTYTVLLTGIRMLNADGRETVWSIVQDISERKAMESQLAEAARRDKLTGLANRARFMERLDQAVLRVRRREQPLFAVLFLDFDRFKLINDTLGHEAGDELLRQIAERLRRQLRASDAAAGDSSGNVVSRFGGDEFLVLINDLKAPDDAVGIAERLLNALAPSYDIQGSEVHSSASIGVVTSEQCQTTADDVVRNADVAMYEAKRAGRACSVVFNEAMHTRLTRHVTIENSLRRAIGSAELYLVYQPIVDLTSGRMVSAEALLRWEHPTLGAIAPSEFIPIAEESNLIVAVGDWVQEQACATLAQWRRQDPDGAPRTISVNVSRAELALGQRLLDNVRSTLERTGLPAHCLQLEVTEREVMRHPEAARAVLEELRSLGVQLAMDDFGTGTSSLGCLRHYPFNTIKIDRSFVQDIAGNSDVLAVIHATIALVENLGMNSLAEGVEDAAQVAVLQSLGCRYAQGYFFSRPVPADQFLGALPLLAASAQGLLMDS